MVLDARVEARKLAELYAVSPRQNTFNALVTGEAGSGKSHLIRTARLPIHLDSFDPGGTKTLRDMILKGDVIADVSFEEEDPLNPRQFDNWRRKFLERRNGEYFEHFGTYVLDSSTMWSDAVMNWIMANAKDKNGKKVSRVGQAPMWQEDYPRHKVEMTVWIKQILALPCDVIVTGHIFDKKDDATGEMTWRYLSTGRNSAIIPSLFDEVYVMTSNGTSQGVKYELLTQSTGKYQAKTRIGRGKFKTTEEPNIKKLLARIGYDTTDKPSLLDEGGEGSGDSTQPKEARAV